MERGSRQLLAALAGAIALCLVPCRSANAASVGSPPHLLSYIVKDSAAGDKPYRWNFWNPESGKITRFLDLPKRPRLVFWAPSEHLVYYAIGRQIYSATYPRTDALASKVAELPPGDVELMWMERLTDSLRVIVREDIPPGSIAKKPDGTIVYRLKDGSVVLLPADEADERPDEVLSVLERDGVGSWRPISRHAIGLGDDLMIDSDIMKSYWHEDGVSQETILMSYTCTYGKSCGKELSKSFFAALRAAGNYKPADFRYIPASAGRKGIVFQTIEGDTLHEWTPVFTYSKRSSALVRLQGLPADEQIGLGWNGRYLLIAEEYNGRGPAVIDLATGSKVFSPKNARDAVWVP